jgi:hypothetical protein
LLLLIKPVQLDEISSASHYRSGSRYNSGAEKARLNDPAPKLAHPFVIGFAFEKNTAPIDFPGQISRFSAIGFAKSRSGVTDAKESGGAVAGLRERSDVDELRKQSQ